MRLNIRPVRRRRSLVLLGIPLLAAAIAVPTMALSASGSPSLVNSKTFSLKPSGALTSLSCLQPAGKTATAKVTVTRGSLNDTLKLTLSGFKPNLGFDLFTVQRNAPPFGLAWYQSDVETNSSGSGTVTIKTILLDQIFGFDPDVALTPTNTFHVGFWFDSPAEAAQCLGGVVPPATPTPVLWPSSARRPQMAWGRCAPSRAPARHRCTATRDDWLAPRPTAMIMTLWRLRKIN